MSEKKKPARGNMARFVGGDKAPVPTPTDTTPTSYQAAPLPEAKYPATYRMPARALQLVEAAKVQARAEGNRLSKEDAVAAAIEHTYGHLMPRG